MNLKFKRDPEIRGVLLNDQKKLFPIGWLHKQAYCEFQLYLENIKRIKPPPTKAMIKGGRVHKNLEKEHKEKAEFELTIPEAFELSEREKIILRFREIRVYGQQSGIYGIIDELRIGPNKVIILDDKPGNKAWPSNITQTRGYCLAFQEEFPHSRTLIAGLRNRDTRRLFWEETFGKKSQEDILKIIHHIHSLLNGEKDFQPTENKKKCQACRFKSVCKKFR